MKLKKDITLTFSSFQCRYPSEESSVSCLYSVKKGGDSGFLFFLPLQ